MTRQPAERTPDMAKSPANRKTGAEASNNLTERPEDTVRRLAKELARANAELDRLRILLNRTRDDAAVAKAELTHVKGMVSAIGTIADRIGMDRLTVSDPDFDIPF